MISKRTWNSHKQRKKTALPVKLKKRNYYIVDREVVGYSRYATPEEMDILLKNKFKYWRW